MTVQGSGAEHKRFLALQEQVRRLQGTGKSTLAKDWQFYAEMALDKSIPKKQRDQWADLRDEVGRRLGLFAPPSVQDELFSIPTTTKRSP